MSFSKPPELSEEKRVGIAERELTVAFPLVGNGSREDRIFAYLPTEIASGFPFLINADFLLTASREAMLSGSAWNQWLRDCIPRVFLDGYRDLLNHAETRPEASRFIPVEADLKQMADFFRPVITAIHAELRASRSIAALAGALLVGPNVPRLATDVERALLPADDYPTGLSDIALVLPEWQRDSDRLKAIGVSELGVREIIRVFNDEQWTLRREDEWFMRFFEYLAKRGIKAGTMESVACLPTMEGRCLAPKSGPVFLPLADGGTPDFLQLSVLGDQANPSFLRPSLTRLIASDDTTFAWVRRTLNVREFSTAEYIVEGLLPFCRREREHLTAPIVVAVTYFVRVNASALTKEQVGRLQGRLPLLLTDGTVAFKEEIKDRTLVVPRGLDARGGWGVAFPDAEDVPHLAVLSDLYLANADRATRELWSDFFSLISITAVPPVHRRKVTSNTWQSSANAFECAAFDAHWERSGYVRTFTNAVPPRWLQRLRRGECDSGDHHRANALLKWLVSQSSNSLRQNLAGQYTWIYYSTKHKRVPSEFEDCLENAAWFPSTRGLVRPNEAFLDRPETRELFGAKVPYSTRRLSDEHARLLGVHSRVTSEHLLAYLEGLSAANRPAQNIGVLVKVYRRLREASSSTELKDKRVIYLPGGGQRWRTPQEVVWEDCATVCGDVFGYLEPVYGKHDLRGFFVSKLGVPASPSTKEFANAWLRMASASEWAAKDVEQALEKIYGAVLSEIASARDWPDWWDEFSGQATFWTQSDRFVPPAELFVPDDGELKALFRDAIEFAWIPGKRSFGEFERFFDEFSVPTLSESTEVSLEDAESAESVEAPAILTNSSKRLIFTWLWNQFPEELQRLVEGGQMACLIATSERRSSTIRLRYNIKSRPDVPPARERRLAFWSAEDHLLYLVHAEDTEALRQEVAEALVRALWGGRNLKDFVPKVFELLCAGPERARSLTVKRDWALTAEREAWLRQQFDRACDAPPNSADAASASATTTTQPVDASGEKIVGAENHRSSPGGERADATRTRARNGGADENGSPSESPSAGKSRPQRSQNHSPASSRLRSYIAPLDGDDKAAEGDETTHEQRALGRTAEEFVVRWESDPVRTGGARVVTHMPPNHPGYDVESRGLAHGDIRYIEVKGLAGAWGAAGVSMTARQMQEARARGESYWLYVVEDALGATPKLHRFQNPAALIASYHLDENWRELRLADSVESKQETDALLPGARVLVEGRPATFHSVVDRGTTTAFRVRFDDGDEAIVLDRNRLEVGGSPPSV